MRLLGGQHAEAGDEIAQGEAIAGEADLEEVEHDGEVVALAVELGVGMGGAVGRCDVWVVCTLGAGVAGPADVVRGQVGAGVFVPGAAAGDLVMVEVH